MSTWIQVFLQQVHQQVQGHTYMSLYLVDVFLEHFKPLQELEL